MKLTNVWITKETGRELDKLKKKYKVNSRGKALEKHMKEIGVI